MFYCFNFFSVYNAGFESIQGLIQGEHFVTGAFLRLLLAWTNRSARGILAIFIIFCLLYFRGILAVFIVFVCLYVANANYFVVYVWFLIAVAGFGAALYLFSQPANAPGLLNCQYD